MDTKKALELFNTKLRIINVGPKLFATVLQQQGFDAIQVEWQPVAGGDREMQDILAMLGGLE